MLPHHAVAESSTASRPPAIDWRVFQIPAVWAPVLMHVAENTSMYAIMQMSPLIYTDVFNVDPAALGKFLALPPALNALCAPVIARMEGYLHRRGWEMLKIQKLAVRTSGTCMVSRRTTRNSTTSLSRSVVVHVCNSLE